LIGAPDKECYDVTVIGRDLDAPAALAPTPDGSLFFVENGVRVRVVSQDLLVNEPALELGNPDSRIVGLAVDESFMSSRGVFVAWTETIREERLLNITRYRALAGSFGEGAQIVSGLPMSQEVATAPLAVDDEGLLYVAIPGGVYRFTRDGLTPPTNPRPSPILAHGYARPSGLAIDVPTGRVWLGGEDPSGIRSLAVFTTTPGAMTEWPIRPAGVGRFSLERGASAPVLAFEGSALLGRPARLLIASGGRLFAGGIPTLIGAAADLPQLQVDVNAQVFGSVAGSDRSLYLLTGIDALAEPTTLVKLTPR
jgi:hypothetical protein